MAFTFARCLDRDLGRPALQMTILGALLTVGTLDPGRDASRGEIGLAIEDLAWLSWNGRDDDLLFIRRARLWPQGGSGGGEALLWIGAELHGVAYRIACAGIGPAQAPRVAAELARLGLDDPPWCIGEAVRFQVSAIQQSDWAATSGVAGTSDGVRFPGRIMSRTLPPLAPGPLAAPYPRDVPRAALRA